jgi:hypothetical protein
MPEDYEDLIVSYLKHLEYVRMPVPTSREQMTSALAKQRKRIENDPYFEAWEDVCDLCREDAPAALRVILELVDRCDSADLGALGAGPIEDLAANHAAALADQLERLIRTNARFFEAYKYVRMGGVPIVIQRRLNAVLVERGVPAASLCEFPES